jgi:hypothetical protein
MLGALALSRFGRAHAAYGRPGPLGIAGVIAVALLSIAVAYWSVSDFRVSQPPAATYAAPVSASAA